MIRFNNLKSYVKFVSSLPDDVSKVTLGMNFNLDKAQLEDSGIDHGIKSVVLVTLTSIGQFCFARNYDLIDSDVCQDVQKLYLSLDPIEDYKILQLPPFDDETLLLG